MIARMVIEYPAAGATYSEDKYGVYRYDAYPRGSVLEGQERRSALDQFGTLEEAKAAYPNAEWDGGGCGYREVLIPESPPDWFDPMNAGESWSGDGDIR